MCGGGGSSAPTQQTVTQVTIPPELMPYAKKALGTAEDLVYKQPYQTYEGQRLAGLNPLQQQGIRGTAELGPTQQIAQASGLAGLVGQQAGQMGSSFQPMQYQPIGVSYTGTQAPQLQQYQMGPAERVGAQSLQQYQMSGPQQVGAERFGTQAMQDYMSPYMSGVVEQQKRAAVQDYARQMPGLQAQGIRSGARGGTREALLQAEANRNLQQQLQGIQATGSQQAFQQAAQQFGADRAAQMQAAMANQQAGLTTGQQNLAALLGVQQLGAQTGLQAALANQQAGLTTGQQNLAAQLGTQQLGANQSLQSQQLNQAAQLQAQQQALGQNQAAQQAMEQSRQFGANLGLQGLQQQLAAAGTLGQLGQQQFGQQQMASQAQQQTGAQMQQLEQQRLQMAYEDFLNRQRYPYQQLGFMSDLIRGTPTAGGVEKIYGSTSSPIGALAGLGGLYMANKGG